MFTIMYGDKIWNVLGEKQIFSNFFVNIYYKYNFFDLKLK